MIKVDPATGLRIGCPNCKYLNRKTNNTCLAFPNGIPLMILSGKFNHKKEWHGDNDIRYEPIEPIEPVKPITVSPIELQYILQNLKISQLPKEGRIQIKIGIDTNDVDFKTGKDKAGINIKTQSSFWRWKTDRPDGHMFSEYVRLMIEQELMKKPIIPKDVKRILSLSSKSFNDKARGASVRYEEKLFNVDRIGNDKYGLFIELHDHDGRITVYKRFLQDKFEDLIKQIQEKNEQNTK